MLEANDLAEGSSRRQRAPRDARACCSSGHDRGRHHHRRAQLDEERRGRTRPRDAPDQEGQPWHFGMKAHIGVDADSGLVHTVTTTAANVADVEQVPICCMARKNTSGPMRATAGAEREWSARACNGTWRRGRATSPSCPKGAAKAAAAEARATQGQRAGEGRASVSRHQEPVRADEGALPWAGKEHAHVVTLFALSNLWMARRQLMAMAAVRLAAHEARRTRRKSPETTSSELSHPSAPARPIERSRVLTLFRPSLDHGREHRNGVSPDECRRLAKRTASVAGQPGRELTPPYGTVDRCQAQTGLHLTTRSQAQSRALAQTLAARLLPPSLMSTPRMSLEPWTPHALALLRIVAEYFFLQHGSAKFSDFLTSHPLTMSLSHPRSASLAFRARGRRPPRDRFVCSPCRIRSVGEMAVAYFMAHASKGTPLIPMLNQGEEQCSTASSSFSWPPPAAVCGASILQGEPAPHLRPFAPLEAPRATTPARSSWFRHRGESEWPICGGRRDANAVTT